MIKYADNTSSSYTQYVKFSKIVRNRPPTYKKRGLT